MKIIKQIAQVIIQIIWFVSKGVECITRQFNKFLDKIILILQENKCDSGEDDQVELNKHGFPFYFGRK
jgi:hypothetical protein